MTEAMRNWSHRVEDEVKFDKNNLNLYKIEYKILIFGIKLIKIKLMIEKLMQKNFFFYFCI